jgi:hypothetical protein
VLGDVDAVHQQRDQIQARQVGARQLGQGVLGSGNKPAGDRRLRGPPGGRGDLLADGFQPCRIPARRQLGQHPLQRQLAEQLGAGKRLVARQWHLPGPVGGPDPRSAYPHPAATKGDLARLAAVAHRGPIQVVAPPGADQPGDVLVQHRLQHLQPRADRQREQALTGGAGKLGNRDGDRGGQLQLRLIWGTGVLGILRHGGPLLSSFLADARHLPHGRLRRGPPPQLLREPG